jgi:hypothetical protein
VKRLLKASASVFLVFLVFACAKKTEDRVAVRETETGTVYSAKTDSCEVHWEYHAPSRTIKHVSSCKTLAEQAPLIVELAGALGREKQKLDSLTGISVEPNQADVSFRIALAAHRSMGGYSKASTAAQLAKALNDQDILKEIREPFASIGLKWKVGSLEKVSTMPAKQLPYFDQLVPYGVLPGERLPYDCWLWLVKE